MTNVCIQIRFMYYFQQPIKGLLIAPGNVASLATLMSNTVGTTSTAIAIGAGTANEILLEVPINPPQLTSVCSIRVTVGFENPGSQDHDPRIGLTDGTKVNQFRIRDAANYGSNPPCDLVNAVEITNVLSGTSPMPHQVTFLFSPVMRFGACYTAQDGGYVSAGRFDDQLILTNGLKLQVQRDSANEEYIFFYFLVEFLD